MGASPLREKLATLESEVAKYREAEATRVRVEHDRILSEAVTTALGKMALVEGVEKYVLADLREMVAVDSEGAIVGPLHGKPVRIKQLVESYAHSHDWFFTPTPGGGGSRGSMMLSDRGTAPDGQRHPLTGRPAAQSEADRAKWAERFLRASSGEKL